MNRLRTCLYELPWQPRTSRSYYDTSLMFLSRTFRAHPGRRSVQGPHSSQAGCSIEILLFEAFGSPYTRTNSRKPDLSSDLEI